MWSSVGSVLVDPWTSLELLPWTFQCSCQQFSSINWDYKMKYLLRPGKHVTLYIAAICQYQGNELSLVTPMSHTEYILLQHSKLEFFSLHRQNSLPLLIVELPHIPRNQQSCIFSWYFSVHNNMRVSEAATFEHILCVWSDTRRKFVQQDAGIINSTTTKSVAS